MSLFDELVARHRTLKRNPSRRRLARPIGQKLALDGPSAGLIGTDDKLMVASFVISTPARDKGGDEMNPLGVNLENYKKNPVVLFGHGIMGIPYPIGQSRQSPESPEIWVYPEPTRIWAKCRYGSSCPEGPMLYGMTREGLLNSASVGFDPLKAFRLRPQSDEPGAVESVGYAFDEWTLNEWSIVPVPMNQEANRLNCWQADRIASIISRPRYEGERMTSTMIKALTPYATRAKVSALMPRAKRHVHSEPFDVDQQAEPSTRLYDWVSKYLGCRVRDVYRSSEFVPHVRAGSLLSGYKQALTRFACEAVRNFHSDGSESPPQYKTIRLNSKTSDDFLVSGLGFYKSEPARVVVHYDQSWEGYHLTFFAKNTDRALVADVVKKAREWAESNNFLKGEAFSLGGEFLSRTAETWDDVFLESHNKSTVRRVVDLFNDKQKTFANRGMILTGPPGTGKTLSGRIIRNVAKGSFIWLSAKDFSEFGSVGGMSFAFELAKSLSPAILFMEDVDNWLSDRTIDLIKTEMDGIARSSGVLTILTTNYPERLPDALIDRPGRFHDVLKFDVPDDAARFAMLTKWLAGYPAEQISKASKFLAGYSGAHVWEAAEFVKTLRDHDGLAADVAVETALGKISEQRQLIERLQSEGASYDRRRKAYYPARWIKCKGALEDCVSRKIPKLVDEGYDQEQAAAIAYSKCGEQKMADTSPVVQSIKLPKDKYPTEDDAKKYVESAGLSTDKPMHDDANWVFQQFDPAELEGTPEEKPDEGGAIIVVGTRRKENTNEPTVGIENPGDENRKIDDGPVEETDDQPAEVPRKAGDIWLETLGAHLSAVLDMLEDTEATQERPDILEIAPTLREMLTEIQGIVADMGTADGVTAEADPKPSDEEKKEKAHRLRHSWTLVRAGGFAVDEIKDAMAMLKDLYAVPLARPLSHKHRQGMKALYARLKAALSRSPNAEPTASELAAIMRETVAEQIKPLKERLERVVNG